MNIMYCIIGAFGCAGIGGLVGFVAACVCASNAWSDGFRAGYGGRLVEGSGEIAGAKAPRNTRKGTEMISPEDVPMVSEWDAALEMWRTVPREEIEKAEAQRVSLGMTVWCVVCTVVLCAGLLFWANRIFTAEEAAVRARQEAGRVYLGNATREYGWDEKKAEK